MDDGERRKVFVESNLSKELTEISKSINDSVLPNEWSG